MVTITMKTLKVMRLLASVALFLYLSVLFQIADASTHYTYDELNRVAEVFYDNGLVEQYTYDSAGNRTSLIISNPQNTHSLSTSVIGNGYITSDPYGINCGETCNAEFENNTQITLSAVPASGYSFEGWSGGNCTGTGDCIIEMDNDYSISATFSYSSESAYRYSLSSKSLDFFGVDVGGSPEQKILTISNTGAEEFSLESITISGQSFTNYSILSTSDTCSQSLLPSGSACSVTVNFTPSSEAIYQATLSISSTTPEIGSIVIPLSGTGVKSSSIPVETANTSQNYVYGGTQYYSMNLVARQGVSVTVDANLTSGNLDFGLFDANDHEMVGSDDGNIYDGESGKLSFIPTVTGVYYVKVWGSSASGNYDLAVYNAWFNPGVVDSDRDFYSSEYTSRYIADGNYTLSGYGNEYFRFTASAGVPVVINVSPHLNTGNIDLNIHDQFGVSYGSSGYIYDGQTNSVSITPVVSGVYFLRVDRNSGAYGSYDIAVSAGYESDTDSDVEGLFDASEYYYVTDLSLVDTDGDGVSDYDELLSGECPTNDLIQVNADNATIQGTAVQIPHKDTSFNVVLPGSSTWYSFTLQDNEGVTVTLSPHLNYGNLDFNLYDESGSSLGSSGYIYDDQTGIVSYKATIGGTFYIRVDQNSGAYGDFDLAVYNAWFNVGVTDNDREFYSSEYTSRYLEDGTYVLSGHSNEYFRFTASAGVPVVINASPHFNTGNIDLNIHDQFGVSYGSTGYIYDGQTNSVSFTPVVSGVYFLRIDRNSGAYGSYDITVSSGYEPDTDSDGEGLNDALEYYYGTELSLVDTDEDGVSDYDELLSGDSPTSDYVQVNADNATIMGTAVQVPHKDAPFNVVLPGSSTWYSFTLQDNEGVTVTLSPHLNYGNLDFNLYDQSGSSLGSSGYIYDDQTGIVSYKATIGGTFYIRVDQNSGAYGDFDMAVYNAWFNIGVFDSDRDFYSSEYTSRYIADGNYALSGHGNEYFRFTASAGVPVVINASPHFNTGNIDLNIHDQFGVSYGSSGYIYDGQTNSVSFTPVVSGVYFLRVDRNSGAYGRYDIAVSAGYESDTDGDSDGLFDASEYYHGTDLSLADTDGDTVSDYDELFFGECPTSDYVQVNADNATIMGTAVQVPHKDAPFNVVLPGSSTWYSFTLQDNEGVTVTLSPHLNYGNLDFNLYDQSGGSLGSSGYIYDDQTGIVSYKATIGGTFYIRVDQNSGAYGDFDLAVYNAWFNAGVIDTDRDFYSSEYTSRYIADDNYVLSRHSNDYFRFSASAGVPVIISASPHFNTGNIDLNIRDQFGIGYGSSGYIYDGQTNSVSFTPVVSGVYFLRVDRNSEAYGNYDLTSVGVEVCSGYPGDVNCDGKIDIADVIVSLQLLSGNSSNDQISNKADVNGDEKIGLEDVIHVLKKVSE